jgi:serine/threonine protein phosphatase PrpC
MDATATTCTLESTWPARFSLPPDIDEACPALVTRAYGRTDRGQVRPQNEDQFLIASPAGSTWVQQSNGLSGGMQHVGIDSQLFVVADGMGGHAGGAHASALAVSAVEAAMLSALRYLFALHTTDDEQDVGVLAELCTALQRADIRVCEEAARRPELLGMGTTLTVAYRHGSRLFIAHAGDSRGYLLRGDKLYRLTQDHTLVNEMIQYGILESEEDARAPFRSVITNVVGGTPGVNVEVHRVQLLPEDVLLLCTDGLTGMLPDARIAILLDMYPDPREACERLVDAANEAGGHDNVTAIVARCEELQGPDQ